MRFRLHCLPFFGFGVLSVCWMFALIALPQTTTNRGAPAATKPGENGAIPMPADRAEDSYSIYSLLMPGETLSSLPAEQGATWAIADVTVNDADRSPSIPPQGQLKPPPENPRGFNEAVVDHELNRNTRVQLEKKGFHLTHSFALVNADGAKSAGYPGVTYFSEVYFDGKHDAALVYRSEWCANLCSSGTWIYLEKHGGRWVRRSGIVVPGA
ncbi:MAG: hypothetical protein WBD98_07985 [Acidobacteriaceae bacterium]